MIIDRNYISRFIYALSLISFVLISISGTAQKYNFKNYSLEEGLVQSQVTAISQDNNGNMWFATFGGGVAKFNGQTFVTYNTKNGIISNDIREIIVDNRGNFWFGGRNGGKRRAHAPRRYGERVP